MYPLWYWQGAWHQTLTQCTRGSWATSWNLFHYYPNQNRVKYFCWDRVSQLLKYWQFMIIFQLWSLPWNVNLNEIWLELPAWIQLYNFVPRSLVSAWIWNVTDSDHNIGRIRQPQREGGSSHSPWQSLREGFFHKKIPWATFFRSILREKKIGIKVFCNAQWVSNDILTDKLNS